MWRNLAERAENQLKKGSMIYVEGKLTTRKWEDKDKNVRYTTEVVASYYRNIKRDDNSGGGGNFPTAEPASNKAAAPVTDAAAPAPDDDLPF